MSRNPLYVCEQLIEVMPEEHKPRFEKLFNDLIYKAPELIRESFEAITVAVNTVVGPPPLLEPWQVKAVAILMDISEDAARERFGETCVQERGEV